MFISRIVFDISNFISEKGGDALAIIYKWTCVERMSLLTHRIIYIFLMDLYEEINNTFVNIKKRNIFGIVGDVSAEISYCNNYAAVAPCSLYKNNINRIGGIVGATGNASAKISFAYSGSPCRSSI